MITPFSKCYGKISVGFCFNTEKRLFFEVSTWNLQKKQFLLQNGTKIFHVACFYVRIIWGFEDFAANFLEKENFQSRKTFKILQ